jgi:7-carboxy-7-deazaguanine synthase
VIHESIAALAFLGAVRYRINQVMNREARNQTLQVTEIFHSLQGETSLSGVRFAFIRLTGCNLRCAYCDSAYAFKGGQKRTIDEISDLIRPWRVRHVLLTGGEPLLQRPSPALVHRLALEGYQVSIETHGETLPHAILSVRDHARIVMDIKTPSSGMSRGGWRQNLRALNPLRDEIKFVIASPEDYTFAKDIIRNELSDREGNLLFSNEVLLSPVMTSKGAPGKFPGVDATWLAERLIQDQLPARLQMQLHKFLWGADRTGV